MKIYIVYDPLCETVLSAHKTYEGAQAKSYGEEKDKDIQNRDCYYVEILEFELEN